MTERLSRRRALAGFGSLLATSPLLNGQELPAEPAGRIAPRDEVVNVFEIEAMARRKLPETVYSAIAGSDRRAFDRMTFRPRMLVNVTELDLTTELFGEKLFAPIIAGPMAEQKQFHPEAEVATVRGASAAQACMIVSSRASHSIEEIAAQSKTPLWYQIYPESDINSARKRVETALRSGCKAVCLTVAAPKLPAAPDFKVDWNWIDQFRRDLKVPFLLKGVMDPKEAQLVVQRGVNGLIVSNHGGMVASGLAQPIEMLPPVVDAVGGKVPVMVDGNFRRGTDVLKALALGARAVLVGRPVMWGLAAYGAEGVQTVLEMFQSELARSMGLSGKANIKALDRSLIKIHKR
jgi:4-hydroxymandelate oxidase